MASSSLTSSQKERVMGLPGLIDSTTGRGGFLEKDIWFGVVARRKGYRDTDPEDLLMQLRMQATDQILRAKASQSRDYFFQAEKLKLGKVYSEAIPDLLSGVTGTIGRTSYEYMVFVGEIGFAIVSAKDSDVVVKKLLLLPDAEVTKTYNAKLLELARSALRHSDTVISSLYLIEAKAHGEDSLEFYSLVRDSYALEGRQAEVQQLDALIASRFASGGSSD